MADVRKVEPKEGLLIILDDLDFSFTQEELDAILTMWKQGGSIDVIGEYLRRLPDEILLALIHLHRNGKEVEGLFTK